MSEHKRRPWTGEEHAHMVALLREGKTIQQIADALGRAHGSVASRSSATDSQGQYHGSMAFQPWPTETKAVAHRMYDDAESFEAIAAAIGPAVQMRDLVLMRHEIRDLRAQLRTQKAGVRAVIKAAVELVCAPAWAGVSDEDVALEQALRDAGFVTPNVAIKRLP